MTFHLKGIGCPEYKSLGPGNPSREAYDLATLIQWHNIITI